MGVFVGLKVVSVAKIVNIAKRSELSRCLMLQVVLLVYVSLCSVLCI